jgi:uncharacterized protein (DUF2249 family)
MVSDPEAPTDTERPEHTTDEWQRLDAREIDGEPFGEIVAALEDLPADNTLLLVNSFEPVPLYDVLQRRGFDHETQQVNDEEWHVSITHA